MVVENGFDVRHSCFRGWYCSCELRISIVHDHYKLVAVCRLGLQAEYIHGDELEWATGCREFWILRPRLIRLIAFPFAAIGHS